jgi:hypothetical protein
VVPLAALGLVALGLPVAAAAGRAGALVGTGDGVSVDPAVTVNQLRLDSYCDPAAGNTAHLSGPGPTVAFAGPDVSGYGDAAVLQASARWAGAGDCGMELRREQGLTVDAGTSGLLPGDPVLLAVDLALSGALETGRTQDGAFSALADATAWYEVEADGPSCSGEGEGEGTDCGLLRFGFDLDQQAYDTAAGMEVDRRGGWSVRSNDPASEDPGEYWIDSCGSECSRFAVDLAPRTVGFWSEVGAHLALSSALSTHVYASASSVAAADFGDTFGAGPVEARTAGAVVVYDGATTPGDTTAPTSTASATRADGTAYEDGRWSGQAVMVTLAATDEPGGSGVAELRYAVAGGPEVSAPGSTASLPTFGEGSAEVRYYAVDEAGNVESPAHTFVVRVDTTAPSLAVEVSPDHLWPPNHRMVPVTATVTAADEGSGLAEVVLLAVTSNEGGDDAMAGWVVGPVPVSDGAGEVQGYLLAERAGRGTGRTYGLTLRATDVAGNVTVTPQAAVTVPHDAEPTVSHAGR